MHLLLEKKIDLHPADSKTNIVIPLNVPRAYAALLICTRYEPKTVDDPELARESIEKGLARYVPAEAMEQAGSWRDYLPVLNFVTLSLDDSEGVYVGCAHRHSPVQDHIISAAYSSPGFFRHPAGAGKWECVLNCHAVVDDPVTYSLRVFGAEEGEELHDHIQAF